MSLSAPPTVAQVLAEWLTEASCPVKPARALVRAGLKRKQADRLLATPVAQAARPQVATLAALLATQASGGLAASAAETVAVAQALLTEPVSVVVSIEGPSWLDPAPWLPPDGRVSPTRARAVHHRLHGRWLAGRQLTVHCDPPLRIGRRPSPREPQDVRRRRLFSRWDQGLRWDDEGLFSATPEALADQLVAGAQGVAVDAGCGLGSLTLALARCPGIERVVAIEQDAGRLACARHNAGVYGLSDRIRFVHGDAVAVLASTPCDVLVVDPPWGGRDYDRQCLPVGDLGLDLVALLDHAPPDTRLKLPPSILPETLPGTWSWRPAVDADGALKFLVAARA